MRWKDGIIIAIIFFVMIIIIGYFVKGNIWGTLNIISVLLSFLVVLLGGSDILGFISNWFKEPKERRNIYKTLLSEIKKKIKEYIENEYGGCPQILNGNYVQTGKKDQYMKCLKNFTRKENCQKMVK